MSVARSAESLSQLASLIDELIDAGSERRAARIAEVSAGDPVRRAELERMVADFEREAPLLDRPAAERFAALFDDQATRFPPELADRYRPTRELGRGGMATVHLARDLKHARDVAVKVIHPTIASALGGDRFLREIAIVAQLHHPHIVPLYDSGEAGGSLYYVMPYEAGASLRQRLALHGPLLLEDAVLILRDVCDALAYAHQHGIVHRDIKPDNVLLSGRHAMVTDFGVARALTDTAGGRPERAEGTPALGALGGTDVPTGAMTSIGVMLGTPAYMAPEEIAGDPQMDHRADIYSVGVLAYELLAGRPPFVREAREDMLAAHLRDVPTRLATHRPDVPAPLADLVMTCLAKRAEDRWPNADALVHRLEHLAQPKPDMTPAASRSRWTSVAAGAAGSVAAFGLDVWRSVREPKASWRNRWENRQVEPLTDFPGSAVDAAISADGRFVAFLADRDDVFDAFVTEVRSGEFRNLTGGRYPELLNEDVRNLGFFPDGANVWIRLADIATPASVSRVPTLGGPIRPFLAKAVTVAWSPDGSKLAYHESAPGDPIYVADSSGGNPRLVYVARPGIHNHHLSWSPDGRFLFFSHGSPPNEMDVCSIPVDGGMPERVTSHNCRVAYPVLFDDRTLLYTATADDGTGPWLYWMDLKDRVPERATKTVEHYISIAASAEGPGRARRLVATVSNPSVQLWTVPNANGVTTEPDASRLPVPTARSAAPRVGSDGSLVYLASRGGAYGLWRWLSADDARELWKPEEGAVDGTAAISPDGTKLCFPVRRRGRSTLYCTSSDGKGAHALAESLDVRGAGSWSPDGEWIAVAAKDDTGVRVFKVPAEGGPPVRLLDSVSSNPVWSPDGKFIVYSGTATGRSVPVQAVTPDGQPYPFPALSVDRVGDSYRFLPDGKTLVVKLGGFRRQDFWLFDVAAGRRRQLTGLQPGGSLHRFDVSPDGKRILFERVRENSNIVLIDLPRL